jgi:phospholipase C
VHLRWTELFMSCHRLPLAIWNALLIMLFSVFGYASAPCPLNPTNPSVTVCTPAVNDLVQSPVHVVAGTTDSNPVTTMYVYLDNQLTYQVSASTLDTFVNVPIGHHTIAVLAKDSTRATFRKNIQVVMQPPCALNPANQTVTLCSMVSGAVVSLPFHLVAAATDSNPVTSMTLLIDGANVASVPNSAILDQYVSNVPLGTHSATIEAQDSTGAVFNNQFNVTVSDASNARLKLRHIIFFLQENRSFDTHFGMLGAYKASLGLANDVDGIDPSTTLLTSQGQPVQPYHYRTVCTEGLSVGWAYSHQDVDYGMMDGFVKTAGAAFKSTIDPSGTRAMGYYDQSDLPYYYEAATRFATSDRFFSPVLTRTIPNRMYLFTGTSFGNTAPVSPPSGGFTQPTIFDHLDKVGVSWRYYYQGSSISSAFITQFAIYQSNSNSAQSKVVPIANWFNDVKNDSTLPAVIFIERGDDEHPGNNVQHGAAKAASIINGLMCPTHSSTGACVPSASWADSAFILTYDEGGGLWDHVRPIREVKPDSIAPILGPNAYPGDFNESGFRLPMIVFSPWARPSLVSHTARDYTSILRLIEDTFNVPPLTLRDMNADNMMEFFDFTSAAPLLTPPKLPSQPTNGACDHSLEAAPGY